MAVSPSITRRTPSRIALPLPTFLVSTKTSMESEADASPARISGVRSLEPSSTKSRLKPGVVLSSTKAPTSSRRSSL